MRKTKVFLNKIFVFTLCAITLVLSGCGYPSGAPGRCGDGCVTVDEDDIANYSGAVNASDYFSDVLIFAKADNDTEFYDDLTGEVRTFQQLLDRQFSLMAEHIWLVLHRFYKNKSIVMTEEPSNVSDYDIFEHDVTHALSPSMGVTGQGLRKKSCEHPYHVLNFSCPECISAMAGERDLLREHNPFEFTDTMEGGFRFDEETYDFDYGVWTDWEWVGRYELYEENIKWQLAKIVATGEYSELGTVSESDYLSYLEEIDHLGFSSNTLVLDYLIGEVMTIGEKQMIKEFILNSIIGADRVAYDNDILAMFEGDSLTLRLDGQPLFTDVQEMQKHYYKSYTRFVDMLVERAAILSIEGTYPNSYGSYPRNAPVAFPELPKMRVLRKPVSYFEDRPVWETDLKLLLDDYEKIISIVFVPKGLDEDLRLGRQLEMISRYGQGGNDIVLRWAQNGNLETFAFYLMTDWFFNFVASEEGEFNEFIVKPTFNVMAQGVQVYRGSLPVMNPWVDSDAMNRFYTEDSMVVMSPSKMAEFDIIHDLEESGKISMEEASKTSIWYNISYEFIGEGMQRKRMRKFDGDIDLDAIETGELSVWNDWFQLVPSYSVNDPGTFVAGTTSLFRSGGNYFQVLLQYFDMDGETPIPTQAINILELTGRDNAIEF